MTYWRTVAAAIAGLVTIAATVAIDSARGAEIVISINKATQSMSVLVDGVATHDWPVSTGLGGGPPANAYRPQRMERKWFSHKYGWSPMPHSIFFHEGYAIHGTTYVSRLGHRASHGCVRLHPRNAATLFELVRQNGMANARIVVSNSNHVAGKAAPEPAADRPDAAKAVTQPVPAYVEPPGQAAPPLVSEPGRTAPLAR